MMMQTLPFLDNRPVAGLCPVCLTITVCDCTSPILLRQVAHRWESRIMLFLITCFDKHANEISQIWMPSDRRSLITYLGWVHHMTGVHGSSSRQLPRSIRLRKAILVCEMMAAVCSHPFQRHPLRVWRMNRKSPEDSEQLVTSPLLRPRPTAGNSKIQFF